MSDKTIESLKQAFMKETENIHKDCQMSDRIADYAFGELGSDENSKIKEHLKSCRSCLDLYMDIKVSEEEVEQAKGKSVDVLPGFQKAIEKGKRPTVSPWQKISDAISDFFGGGFGFRPVTTFAAVVMVMVLGFYIMSDTTSTHAPYSIQIMMHGRTQTDFRGGQPDDKEFQVEPGGKIMSGDYFRFQVTIDNDAFVYVVLQDSAGAIQTMEAGFVTGGTELSLPDGDQWFHLDENTGTEKLYLVASDEEIDGFSEEVGKLKQDGIDTIEKVFPDATIQSFSFEHR